MAYFIIYTVDKTGTGPAVRSANRDTHVAFLKTPGEVTVKTAGPWLDDKGAMRGSLVIVEGANMAAVMAWHQTDPYVVAGLSERVEIRPYTWVIGAP